jgi:superfamily II RNA helicase
MKYKNLTLDPFQVKAIEAIENNHSVVVSAPTGSGKTIIADYIINRDVQKNIRVIYTAPIKALSNQKYKEFCKAYGEDKVGMLTGDMVKNPKALILVMTTEIYRNMVIADDPFIQDVSYVVFDEVHYINDVERGYVWEESIIFSQPHVRMICLSATIPNAEELAAWIHAIKEHPVEVVEHNVRLVPLHTSFYDSELQVTTLEAIKEIVDVPQYEKVMHPRRKKQKKYRTPPPSHVDLVRIIKDKLPCMFFSFSRLRAQQRAKELADKNIFKHNPKITHFVRKKLSQSSPEVGRLASTRLLRHTLSFGIGFHHAGLLPIHKEIVEELFAQGLINVLYTTETFAVGINMPAKTACFEGLRKFDGRNFRLLTSKEYFQIAGRAGRRGIDKEGYVYIMMDRRDFEYKKIKKLTTEDTEPITSQFKLSINTVLNVIKQHSPKEIDEILCKSLHSFQEHGEDFATMKSHRSHSRFVKLQKSLEKKGYLEHGKITEKGNFASQVYADELILGEIFATDFYQDLNEYQILLIMGCLCYEPRERTQFYEKFPSSHSRDLAGRLRSHPYLSQQKQFEQLKLVTAFIHPIYHGESIFTVLHNTNLLEGDIVRLLRQIVDRLGQIKIATPDRRLGDMIVNCQESVKKCLEEIDVV